MTPREIASLWLIGVAGIAIIIWDHRNLMDGVLNALGSSPMAQDATETIMLGPSTALTTNDANPQVGNEFGSLATAGNVLLGDVQPQGADKAFGSLWDNMAHQDYNQ